MSVAIDSSVGGMSYAEPGNLVVYLLFFSRTCCLEFRGSRCYGLKGTITIMKVFSVLQVPQNLPIDPPKP